MFRNAIVTTLVVVLALSMATGMALAHAVVYPRSVGVDSFEKFSLRGLVFGLVGIALALRRR